MTSLEILIIIVLLKTHLFECIRCTRWGNEASSSCPLLSSSKISTSPFLRTDLISTETGSVPKILRKLWGILLHGLLRVENKKPKQGNNNNSSNLQMIFCSNAIGSTEKGADTSTASQIQFLNLKDVRRSGKS